MPPLSNKEQALDFYKDQGFTLFPLIGKVPPKNYHWREAPYDPFIEFENNFAVRLRPEYLVVDVDPRNGGSESFERIGIELDGATFTVETGSGGLHLYFKKPAEFKIRKNLPDFKGIDFISDGGYVVGAGSIHPDTGKPYCVILNKAIADAPQQLLDLIAKQEVSLGQGTGSYTDDEQTKSRYREYLMAAPPAIEGQSGDRATFAVAAVGRDYGLSPSTTLALLVDCFNPRCEPPWSIDDLTKKVQNVYKYAHNEIGNKAPTAQFTKYEIWTEEQLEKQYKATNKFFQRNQNDAIKPNLNNTAILFMQEFADATGWDHFAGMLGFNEFSNQIEFLRPAPWHKNAHTKIWTDDQAIECKFWLSNQWKFEPQSNIIHEAAVKAARLRNYHPVRDYILGLRWDGHERCKNWLSEIMGASDNMYTRAIGMKWLVAAVKRIFEPGCKFDYILTLEGKQGTYKSTVFEILAVKKDWYADPSMDIMNKDSIFMMFGKWIIEIPEMHTYFRAETNAMKSFLSRSTDRARMPYERIMRDFPRQSVFGGTINPEKNKDIGWLKDTTGNRRYWPVLVGEKKLPDLGNLREIVHQIWAEAYQLYLKGVPVYLEDMTIATEAENEQAKRLGKDPWQDSIEIWLDAPQNITRNVFSGEEIYKDCIGGDMARWGNREMWRLSNIMGQLYWAAGVHWDKTIKKSVRGYKRPEIL